MEGLSSLRECLYQLEERLLKPGVRTSQKELKRYLPLIFLSLGVTVKFYIKMRISIKMELVW